MSSATHVASPSDVNSRAKQASDHTTLISDSLSGTSVTSSIHLAFVYKDAKGITCLFNAESKPDASSMHVVSVYLDVDGITCCIFLKGSQLCNFQSITILTCLMQLFLLQAVLLHYL